MVTALHACDTATDDAIAFGLQKHARFMVLVPCCQAEVARCLSQHKALSLARTPLAELWRHPLHTREMGSQITNVLRCLYLEACGLPGHGDRAGGLGAQHEERAHPGALHRAEKTRGGGAAAGNSARIWLGAVEPKRAFGCRIEL